MAKQTVALGFGKANFSTVFAAWSCFKLGKVWNQKATAVTSGQNRGRSQAPAGRHGHNGDLISANVEHEQGTILLFQARWTGAPTPIPLREGGIFVRLRAGAPLYNLIAVVPTGPENICGDSFAVFSGCADIMTQDDLAQADIEIPQSYIDRYQNPSEITECFRLVMVVPETIARPSLAAISTPEGVQLKEISALPKRRMRLSGGAR